MKLLYKYIVLTLIIFVFLYFLNNSNLLKKPKIQKENFTDNTLNRTFNADLFLKNLHVDTEEITSKQKIINSIV